MAMSYHIKRIDPYWMTHPLVGAGVAGGVALCAVGVMISSAFLAVGGLIITGVAAFLATRVAVSAVLLSLGFFGGLATFILFPAKDVATMSLAMRGLSTIVFTLLYAVLMDAIVLTAAFLYNLFGALWG